MKFKEKTIMPSRKVIKLESTVSFSSFAAIGGKEERRGKLGSLFDFCDDENNFGCDTWEMAEGEMGRLALNSALTKMNLSHEKIELIAAGDLQNQCVATSLGLQSFGIPFLGIYGACSTCAEALSVIAAFMESDKNMKHSAVVTTSHNSAAERQFRSPIEYGGQRPPSAQWTATAAGAFILGRDSDRPKICELFPGRIVDGATKDGSNMGAAMSFAAAESILSYFDASGASLSDFDLIVTGDLGRVGSDILCDILSKTFPDFQSYHEDCGLLLYDGKRQDVHSGASGCGTSASVLAAHYLPRLDGGRLNNILFMSTGALMSPSSLLQGQDISGIAPIIRICSGKGCRDKTEF